MGKRKTNKRSGRTVSYPSNITKRTYNNIKREARNARARISEYAKKTGNFSSEADEYRLESLINRIESGESSRSILAELRSLRGTKIADVFSPLTVSDETGEVLDVARIKSLVRKANRAIDKATEKYSGLENIFPERLNEDAILSKLNSENYNKYVEMLNRYNARNLKPVTRPEYSDVTTKLQYEIDKEVISKENARRAEQRKIADKGGVGGGVYRAGEYSLEDMDPGKMKSFHELHRRALSWTDDARRERADIWIENYRTSLNKLQLIYATSGMYNTTVQQRFDYINSVLNAVKGKTELVDILAATYLNIEIKLNYPKDQSVDFNAIYNDFCDFADEFLPDYE